MIIIPELKTVLIMPPRTASTSLKAQITKQYPLAWKPYRHMEADGVPAGYESWRKVGLCRAPLSRLWSLYKYCRAFPENERCQWSESRKQEMIDSTRVPFEYWLIHNTAVFATSQSPMAGETSSPYYHTLHPKPETLKSQFEYLRPDLGTEVWSFNDLHIFAAEVLKLDAMEWANRSEVDPVPFGSFGLGLEHLWWDSVAAGGWLDRPYKTFGLKEVA